MKIVNHTPVMVNVKGIKLDPDNPNKMTAEEEEGLKESMERFGDVEPILIDAKTGMICDGEHRFLVYKAAGYEEIPVIKYDFANDAERKLFRQIKNKLKGRHDPDMDLVELNEIMESEADSLASILQIDDGYIADLEDVIHDNTPVVGKRPETSNIEDTEADDQDQSTIEHHADTYLHGTIKQINLYFNNEEFQAIIPRLQKLMEKLTASNHTELFLAMVEMAEKQ